MIGIYFVDGSCIKVESTIEEITKLLDRYPNARYLTMKGALLFIGQIKYIREIK